MPRQIEQMQLQSVLRACFSMDTTVCISKSGPHAHKVVNAVSSTPVDGGSLPLLPH